MFTLFGFSTTSRPNGECLLNETRHRQLLGEDIGNYKEYPTSSQNFMNFGPQTAKIGPMYLTNLNILSRLSPSHVL